MHVHGNLMSPNVTSLYAAAAAEKAAAAQRAADVRKKLMEGPKNIDSELNPEEILIRQWSEANSRKRQGQDHPRASGSNDEEEKVDEEQADQPKIQNADEEQPDKPISTWA